MKKRNPYVTFLLLLLALCVLGATVAEFIDNKSDAPAACQQEPGECFEEEFEEQHLDFQLCRAAFEPLQLAFAYGHDLQFLVFTSPRTIASVRSLGWSMPLRT